MKKELDLNGKIRNLQVSISIARREIKDLSEMISQPNCKDKEKKLTRIAVCQKIINTKSEQLEPLLAQRPARASKVTISNEEQKELLKQAGIQ